MTTQPTSVPWEPITGAQADALRKLAEPFPADEIEWLPKQLRKNDDVKDRCARPNSGVCRDEHPCGGWHAASIHLQYVGHAGITARLLAVDPLWTWEPLATTDAGTPLFTDGGLWIRLTVAGVTTLGYGDASGKNGPNAVKEIIGDAIRNAAMRRGAGTYLWSKSEAAAILKAGGDPDAGDPPGYTPAAPPAREAQPTSPVVSDEERQREEAQLLAVRALSRRTVAKLTEVYADARTAGLLHVTVRGRDGAPVELDALMRARKAELEAAASTEAGA